MSDTAVALPSRHYRTPVARRADLLVHVSGLMLAVFGGTFLIVRSALHANGPMIAAIVVYVLGLGTMFLCSAAYNFARASRQPVLRKLDHAGIFVMIAGSYTPLLVHALSGAWQWSMTLTVWAIALFGVFAKLFLPGLGKGFWVAIYLLLGWVGIAAIKPIVHSLEAPVLALIAASGLIYTVGVFFYMSKRLVFFRAIWHGHVLAAAAAHWVAMLLCVGPGETA
ncbi:MAG: hemolysin III family protein [Pseudoxanthomonas sp.]